MKKDQRHINTGNRDVDQFIEKSSNAQLPEFSKSKEEIWSAIDQRTKSSNNWVYWMAAAMAVIAFGFIFLLIQNDPENSVMTSFGEIKTINLPDGSTAELNSSSELVYDKKWTERTVSLKGEAFFQVSEGKTFSIKTNYGVVQVLGTSFNVIVRSGQFAVDCKTGVVSVTVPQLDYERVIKAGERVILESGEMVFSKSDPTRIGSWIDGQFYYDNRPVSEVFEEVERQFNVKISSEGFENKRFSGYFINKDLTTALTMICEPMDLAFGIVSGDQVDIQPRSDNQ